ncbi:MAG: Hsp20/alpha crystallin family protein [Planctomycetes bacterium]|nr:Hsp20/alpha crystallin family protein [Planctomycetota bacterium]
MTYVDKANRGHNRRVSLGADIDKRFSGFFSRIWSEPAAVSSARMFGPVIPIYVTEDKKTVVVKAGLSGLEKKDIKVNLQNDFLNIKVEKKEEIEKKNGGVCSFERRYDVFSRSMLMPSGINSSKTRAVYKNGILTVALAKTRPERQACLDSRQAGKVNTKPKPVNIKVK